MSQKSKSGNAQPAVVIDGEVVRKIRQHARSSIKAEICGVLIGRDRPGKVEIQACIPGENAEEAGAHVTLSLVVHAACVILELSFSRTLWNSD